MLSDSDTRAIQAMRQMLSEWEGMAHRQADTLSNHREAFCWGVFSQSCRHARALLHEVLLSADTYLDDVHAAATERGQR